MSENSWHRVSYIDVNRAAGASLRTRLVTRLAPGALIDRQAHPHLALFGALVKGRRKLFDAEHSCGEKIHDYAGNNEDQ